MPVSVPVDFSGVEARKSVKVPEGDYLAKVSKIEKTTAKTSGNPMLVVDFEFKSGGKGVEGQRIRDRHILIKDSLWTLRNMLECMGLKVPNGKMTLKEQQIVGRTVGLQVVDGEEYKGRVRSEVADYLPKDAVGNRVSGDEIEEDDWEDDDDLEDEEVGEDEAPVDEDDDDDWDDDDWDDDEDDDEDEDEEDEDEDAVEEGDEETEEVELSFDEDDVKNGKGPDLKGYIAEAKEAGWEFDLPQKPKVADVREALLALFEDDDEDDDELEGFNLEDMDD